MNHTKLLGVVAFLLLLVQWGAAQIDYRMRLDRAGADGSREVIELANGHILVAGTTINGASDSSGQDAFLMEINPVSQAVVWSQAYDMTPTDILASVIQASNGDIIAAGSVTEEDSLPSKWFLHVNPQGQVLHSTTFGRSGQTSITQIVESVNIDNGQATYIVTGPHDNFDDVYAARVRADGSLVWQNEYTNVDSWTYSAVEASDGTIYLVGNANTELQLYILTLDADGTINKADEYSNDLNVVGGIRRAFLVDDQTLAVVGVSRVIARGNVDTRAFFMEFDLTTMEATTTRYFNTPTGEFYDGLDFTPTYDNGVHNGYVFLLRQADGTNNTRFVRTDITGQVQSYYSINSANQIGKVQALADEEHFIHLTDNDGEININHLPLDGLSTCMDTFPLTTVDTVTTRADNNTTVVSLPLIIDYLIPFTDTLVWRQRSSCCSDGVLASCCQVTANSTDYVHLDPDNPDANLADFGIARFMNTRLYIMGNEDYNRMPARLHFAEDVILFVRTPNNALVPTTMDITNADLVFGSNSGIIVEAGSKLIGHNAVLRPCSDLETWNGIRVEGAASGNLTTAITLKECTFINAHYGLAIAGTIEGTVSENLFHNCQYGIAAGADAYQIALTNNTFEIDDNVIGLSYYSTRNPNNTPWFVVNSTMINRFQLEHVGISYHRGSTLSNSLISQNSFINALSLGQAVNPRFNGIVLNQVRTVDIADNRFLNNDMGVVANYSQNIAIENNFFEVTRHSVVDESFYQVVNFGMDNNGNGSAISTLIQGNTFRNTADVQEFSLVDGTEVDSESYLQEGSGAIYNFGGAKMVGNNPSSAVKIIDNDIKGFQIGIYTERGQVDQITNNKIEADVYGIYAHNTDGLIGCNEITMDLEANVLAEGGVTGIRVAPNRMAITNTTHVFGNCIKNTDRAIFFSLVTSVSPEEYVGMGNAHVQNNYLFNYTEAGLFLQNYSNTAAQAELIRRNAFISNQENGVSGNAGVGLGTGVFDIMTANLGSTNNSLTLGANYYGADNLASFLAYDAVASNPTAYTAITLGATDAKPFTACGNLDADITTLTTEEQDWLTRCNDENFIGNNPISQRTATTGITLTADYQTALALLGEEDNDQAVATVTSHMSLLSNLLEVQQLYTATQQLSFTHNQQQWLNAAYYSRLGNWAAAAQALNNVIATAAEAEQLAVAKAQVAVAQQGALQDATLVNELKAIAQKVGLYKHEARALLNQYTHDTYSFDYNPVKVYTKIAKTSRPLQQGNSSSLQLLPNPASTTVQVQLMDNNTNWTTAELYDLHGRLIQSQQVNAYQLQFDVSKLAPSVYFITLKGENGTQVTEKFVKQ